VESYGKLPLSFEINQGQTDSQVKFISRGSGYSLFLTGNEAVLALRKPVQRAKGKWQMAKGVAQGSPFNPAAFAGMGSADLSSRSAAFPGLLRSPAAGWETKSRTADPKAGSALQGLQDESRAPAVLRMKLVGADPQARVTGLEQLPGKSNYFIGNDPKKWRTNVPTYAKVKYASVYPGVDLVYYGNQGKLEHDFVVSPGADPAAITLELQTGESKIQNPESKIDKDGDLVVGTNDGEVIFHKPVVYQPTTYNELRTTNGGGRDLVEGRYVLRGDHQIAFQLADYDLRRPVVIDPVLAYSTYLGGSGYDAGGGIAVDASGNAYVTGCTNGSDFPATPGAFQTTYQSGGGGFVCGDAFVTKLNAAGSTLLYSTFLGGSDGASGGDQGGYGIAVDASGNAYVTGSTPNSDFPTTPGAFQTTYRGGPCGACGNAFVTKLSATGSVLLYSTFLGGTSWDWGNGIAVDAAGNAYMTGFAQSRDFPTTPGAFQTTNHSGNANAFVSKLNATGSALLYSTFLGGTTWDWGNGVALDASDYAYVAGCAESSNFPTTPGAFQTAYAGGDGVVWDNCGDAFVTKLSADGSALVYSTYLGGSNNDTGSGIAVDALGSADVTGWTVSPNFPTTPGAFQASGNGGAFVSKLNAAGSALVYSTYLGGSGGAGGSGIAVDASGNACVTGSAGSGFPTTPDAFQTVSAGGKDAFVSKLNATGSALLYSTYLGGSGDDSGSGIALDGSGNAYVTGTSSSDFPVTSGAFQTTFGGWKDAFVAKFSFIAAPALTLTPSSLAFGPQAVGTTSAVQKVRLSNVGTKPLEVTSILPSGDFAQTNDCPASLSPAGFCTLSVTFAPSTTGTRTGVVTITDNAAGSPHKLPLTGVGGVPAVSLTPATMTFASQAVGTTSTAQLAALKNTGAGPLSITSIARAGDFAQTTNCGSTVNAGASCTVSVTFTPTAAGTRTGSVTITDDAAGSPHQVLLTGTGFFSGPAVSLTPTSLTFAAQAVGTFSAAQQVTLKNTGGGTLKIASIGRSGDFYEGHNCPMTLVPNASCTLRVTFAPTSAGTRSGTVTIADNAPGSLHRLALSGTGSGTGSILLKLTPGSLSFGSVAVGTTSSSQTVTLTNNGKVAASFLDPFGFATSGTNWSDFHKNPHCGTSLAPGKSCTVSVSFKPVAKGRRTGFLLVRQGAASVQIPLSGTGL
jgi:hypothetical protein